MSFRCPFLKGHFYICIHFAYAGIWQNLLRLNTALTKGNIPCWIEVKMWQKNLIPILIPWM